MDCPHCDKEVIDVRGPFDSKKDGFSQFKTVVHEKKDTGMFKTITEFCQVDIE